MRKTALVVALLFPACASPHFPKDDPWQATSEPFNPPLGAQEFESASPELDTLTEEASPAGAKGDVGEVATDNQAPAERAIEEADIIRVDGTRLFALSEYRGLIVIDLTNLNELKVLGTQQAQGSPFEMYFRDNVAYVLYDAYAQYVWDEQLQSWSWQSSSRVVAIDTSDVTNLREIGAFNLPGTISDSRIVGNILYVVTAQSGYCWKCDAKPNVTVTSLQVGTPADIKVIDHESYEEPQPGYAWRRSVSVTSQRMYISGLTWSSNADTHSTIQIVDISNPNGELHQGALVNVAGQITSRWQMDEYQNVLRVVSQPFSWQTATPPSVQTFSLQDSDHVTALDTLVMTLPRPEQLRSVRFDKERAYAVTFQRTDPLFVLDLSDAQNIRQAGELEIPGWIYHMEPRGDRLLAVGFDSNKLAVSLYDVSNMEQPTQLSRVIFGGDWGWMPEDQDRIHKAFNILQQEGLILMPFSGWARTDDYYGGYVSGVQLIDWSNDTLTLRGAAAHKGSARRGFLYDGKLLAMSDDRLDAFDITDRSTPVKLSSLPFTRNVVKTVSAGEHTVELVKDYWDQTARIDVRAKSDANAFRPLGSLDLAALSPTAQRPYYYWWYGFGYGNVQLFAKDSLVYLVWGDAVWCGFCGYSRCSDEGAKTRVAVIDVADPAAPTLRGTLEIPATFGSGYGYYGAFQQILTGQAIVHTGDALVMQQQYSAYGSTQTEKLLRFLDLSNPDAPALAKTVSSPSYYLGLLTDGSTVATSHFEEVPGTKKVRYYLDRFDVSSPSAPAAYPKVSIPGSLAELHGQSAVTIDYQAKTKAAATWQDCRGGYLRNGVCLTMQRTLNALTISGNTATLGARQPIADGWETRVQASRDRIFVSEYDAARSVYLLGVRPNDGTLTLASTYELERGSSLLSARAEDAILFSYSRAQVSVLDTTDAAAPTIQAKTAATGRWFQSFSLDADALTFAQGPYGVQRIPF